MAKTSPTQRTLALLRSEGMTAQVVEKFIVWTKQRVDLFGFADIVALDPKLYGVLAVQTTSGSNISARIKKILANDAAKLWVMCGNRIEVHGWKKRGPRGKRKVWECDRRELFKTDFVKPEPLSDEDIPF